MKYSKGRMSDRSSEGRSFLLFFWEGGWVEAIAFGENSDRSEGPDFT
ncbi:MAG: hypothetical protein AAGD25_31240 [Cyanobacteria bacterium P01_F01_bin.150]